MAATATKKSSSKIKLQPLGDRVVARRDESEEVTAGGLVLPDSAKDKPTRGVVVSVGEGKLNKNGTRTPLQVKSGDRILFTTYGPDEIKVGDETLLLMREDDILAVIDT
jgi:chaperonin GroES